MQTRGPYKGSAASRGCRYNIMGTEPQTRSGGPASGFRKISKPMMEKRRRARINVSLEQLKSLLEEHYSHQIQKRKLEKADILELSVKYMKSLQNSLQGLWPVPSGAQYPSGFRLVHEGAVGSTMDSVSPGPEAPTGRCSCAPVVWAPDPATGGSRPPPPRLLLPRVLPGPSTSVPAPQPASRPCAENPGPGLCLWRPW